MLMKVSLQTDAFHYEGAHQSGVSREGTVLHFDIALEPLIKPSRPGGPVMERRDGLMWKATVDVHNGPEDRAKPLESDDYKAQAFGKNPIETLAKLADNLRRVADALDQSLDDGIIVPIELRRKKTDTEDPPEEPEVDDVDQIIAESESEES